MPIQFRTSMLPRASSKRKRHLCAERMAPAFPVPAPVVPMEVLLIFNSLCYGYTDANGKNWTMEGCWDLAEYPGLQKYAIVTYCNMSKCIADGGSSGSCYCQLYHSLCQTYGNERPYNVSVELRSIIDFLLSNSTHLNGFCDRSLCAAHFTTRLMRGRRMLSKQDG